MNQIIDDKNRDQWCFDYLEKQLTFDNEKHFESVLKEDNKLKKELEKWKKTYLSTASVVDGNPELEEAILNKNKSIPYKKILLLASGVLVLLVSIYFLACSKEDSEDYEKVEESEKLPVKPAVVEKDVTVTTPDTTLLTDTLAVKDTAVIPPKKEPIKVISKTTIEPTYPKKVPKPVEDIKPKKQAAKDSVVKKVELAPVVAPVKETIEGTPINPPPDVEESPVVEPTDDDKKRDGLLKRLRNKDEE